MLGLGLSLQKGISAFNAGRALVSSYIRRVTEAGGVLQNTACDAAAINELNQDRLLEPASWVLVPDGIEEDIVFAQKPTSGLGDLTFTRASDATYTDSTGVVRRSPYNLVTFSEDFSNAAWQKLSASISSNVTTAPNGTLTADTLSVTTTIYSGINQALTQLTGSYTSSIYAKKGTKNWLYIIGVSGSASRAAWFNLDTGVVGTVNAGVTATIQSIGDGWYRCTATDLRSGIGIGYHQIGLSDADSSLTPTSSGTAFIWGAQLVEGTSALDYFPTTNRQDVPRIDFRNADGTLSSCGRLLLEPQRTNSIRNSSMVGAVAGSPGTLPTNWSTSTRGLTQTIVGTGVINGLPYIDLRFSGTANATTALQIFPESTTQIVAASGQSWTGSVWAQVISQPSPSSAYNLVLSERTAIGAQLALSSTTFGTSFVRSTLNRTLTNALTERISWAFHADVVNATAYDFTIRIAAPQMELGAYATTWVPTTTAAVTRIADVASKTGVSSLIGQTEGTLFVDIIPTDVTTTNAIGINAASFISRVIIFTGGNLIFGQVRVGSVTQFSVNTSATVGVRYKAAIAYKQNDFAFYLNGAQIAVSNTGTVPACSVISYDAGGATNPFLGRNNQAALFPTRLTNDQLEVLTSEGYGTYALLAESLNCVLQ